MKKFVYKDVSNCVWHCGKLGVAVVIATIIADSILESDAKLCAMLHVKNVPHDVTCAIIDIEKE